MDEYIQKLKQELENPIYDGKTPAEIVEIINNPIIREEDIVIPDPKPEPTTRTIVEDAPVFRVIMGVAGAPNIVTEADVIEALN